MLKLIGTLLKVTFFSIVVLVLANQIYWGKHTVSDQVKITLAHAETSELFHSFKNWATQLTSDARKGFQKNSHQEGSHLPHELPSEDIAPSERQKLKQLIRDLNGSYNN